VLDNVPWQALNTEHAHFAVGNSRARKYPSDVAPFAGTVDESPESLIELRRLLAPGEAVYLETACVPQIPELEVGDSFPALQMVATGPPPASRNEENRGPGIVSLSARDAQAMLDLTAIAFPGFFRARTHEMGAYFGILVEGELVAMAGERMALPGHREISGVCTHPAHTGRGYAARLITHLMRRHANLGLVSFLHVSTSNSRALALYHRLGFSITKEISLYRVMLPASCQNES
jgi:ribosomal protein S18 acetylase RimI-like enzyme